jgi:hypothetical protein
MTDAFSVNASRPCAALTTRARGARAFSRPQKPIGHAHSMSLLCAIAVPFGGYHCGF